MRILTLTLLLLVFSLSAYAADRCYAPEHVRAERLLRLHSELMVVTVTCKQASSGRDLGKAYTGFTRVNVKAIKEAEEALVGYYQAAYGGKGVDRLDTLRTKLANEIGQEVANESAPVFCGKRQDMVVALYDSPPVSLDEEAARRYMNARPHAPICGEAVKTAHKTGTAGAVKAAPKAKKPKKGEAS